jgi:hypothetical protein
MSTVSQLGNRSHLDPFLVAPIRSPRNRVHPSRFCLPLLSVLGSCQIGQTDLVCAPLLTIYFLFGRRLSETVTNLYALLFFFPPPLPTSLSSSVSTNDSYFPRLRIPQYSQDYLSLRFPFSFHTFPSLHLFSRPSNFYSLHTIPHCLLTQRFLLLSLGLASFTLLFAR